MYGIPENYRRVAESFYRPHGCTLDFSQKALLQAFEKETYGVDHDMSKNGWAFGKKAFDITVASWREDLAEGLFCKYDYLRDYEEDSFEYDFIWNVIKNFSSARLFTY
ncbi:hypothetical protein [Xanthomonas phage X1]|nr:hypothetical protein [Xanthomonas phage X1]